jgi:hypothetical protein
MARGLIKRSVHVTAATARKITGIGTPLGGVQWADPGPFDGDTVRHLLLFLEDRRLLYNAANLEEVSQVERAVREIREQCANTLQALPPKTFAIAPIRIIREASRRFHSEQQEQFPSFDGRASFRRGSAEFFAALGSYRATVGQQVALLAGYYDIDIEGDLASVLPSLDDDGKS